jgi:hypothetical protein
MFFSRLSFIDRGFVLAAFVTLMPLAAIGLFLWHYSFNWINADDVDTILWFKRVFITHELHLLRLITSWDNSHPVGAQAILSTVTLKIFGLELPILVAMSFLLICVSVAALLAVASDGIKSPPLAAAIGPLGFALAFHPTQAEHLLWPFQIGWFMVNAALFLNLAAVERYGARGLPAAVVFCAIASFSSAQGTFLWFITAAHCLFAPLVRRRFVWAALFALIGSVATITLAHKINSQAGDYALHGIQPTAVASFSVLLLGGIFGIRDHVLLVVFGATLLLLSALWIVAIVRSAHVDAPQRIGALLILASAMFVGGFAIGRFQFGIDWATDRFHAAPLLVPLLISIAILSIRYLDANFPSKRLFGWVSLGFVLASWLAALPYAAGYADYWLMGRGLAMHVTCQRAPRYLIERANGVRGHGDQLDEALPVLLAMCDASGPQGRAAKLVALPALLQQIVRSNPSTSGSMQALWSVYATRLDLQRAFPIDDPDTPVKLLNWARGNALQGTPEDRDILGPYQAELVRQLSPY